MKDIIRFFAYDDLMDQKRVESLGFQYLAYFCVTLSAYKLVFNKIPTDASAPAGLGLANIEPVPTELGMLEGVMYEMESTMLPKLDEYYQHPREYQRKTMRFTKHDFTLTNAFVYVAHPDRVGKGLKPSKAMMKQLRGARKNLQMLYFSRLVNTPTLD